MTITVDLPPAVETKVKLQAAHNGIRLEDYVASLIAEASARQDRIEALAAKPFDEILAPVRQGFKESGLAEDEIMAMFTEAREEVYQEKLNSQ